MLATYTIAVDPGQLSDLEAVLFGLKNGVPRAITVATNKTAVTGRSRIVKRLAKELNLKAGSAANPQPDTISSFVGVKKATFDTLSATISLTRKGIPLIKFAPSPNAPGPTDAAGVSVKTRKGGGMELLKSTFIARMKNGHIGVYERLRGVVGQHTAASPPCFVPLGEKTEPGERLRPELLIKVESNRGRAFARAALSGRASRLPIQHRYGPTPLGVFEGAPGIAQEEIDALGPILLKNLESQADRLLNPRGYDRTQGDAKGAPGSDE